jgi:hypothetical protein
VLIKEEADGGRFDYYFVSDDPTSPAYIRRSGSGIVSVVFPWNTGKDKGTFYSLRIFAGFSDLVPYDHVHLVNENHRRHQGTSRGQACEPREPGRPILVPPCT